MLEKAAPLQCGGFDRTGPPQWTCLDGKGPEEGVKGPGGVLKHLHLSAGAQLPGQLVSHQCARRQA